MNIYLEGNIFTPYDFTLVRGDRRILEFVGLFQIEGSRVVCRSNEEVHTINVTQVYTLKPMPKEKKHKDPSSGKLSFPIGYGIYNFGVEENTNMIQEKMKAKQSVTFQFYPGNY